MAVRPTMSYLITIVRELLNDVDPTKYHFTDQQIQDRLDIKRVDVYLTYLSKQDTLTENAYIEWHDFWGPYPYWETDFKIQKTTGEIVTPDVSEPMIGKWFFTENQLVPLQITGKAYNVYGVASVMMNMWVGDIRSQISSWTADGTTVQRAGQIKAMQSLADDYASMAWGFGNSTTIKLVRKDMGFRRRGGRFEIDARRRNGRWL